MKVSVVIPVLNGEDAVVRCVEACLGQGRPPDEVIVVDNGSDDSTAERARLAGARVLSEEARGSSFARNRGWRAADADVVAFTDVDCVPAPDWLEELLAPFDDAAVAGVGGDIVLMEVHSAGQRWFVERHFLDQATNTESSFLPFFATANAAFRRHVLEELGGFDGVIDPAGDTDFSWRVGALLHGHLVHRPQAVVRHDVSRDLAEVTGRWRRYAAGIYLLERRWADWPGFPQPEGFWSRTRRLWELPLALGNRMRTRRDLAIPFLDAAVAVNREIGRIQGRRLARHLDVVEIGHPSTLGSPVTSVPAGRP